MIAFLALTASADPIQLPEMIVMPDPLEPSIVNDISTTTPSMAPVLGPPTPVQVRLADPGVVVMTTATVDTPPKLVGVGTDVEGPECDLVVAVDRQGNPGRVKVSECDDAANARDAKRLARTLQFDPATYDGRAVAVADVRVTVTVPSQTPTN